MIMIVTIRVMIIIIVMMIMMMIHYSDVRFVRFENSRDIIGTHYVKK